MALYIDQLGRQISLPHIPQRIVSLVPSQTELLFHLGLDHQIIGITKFCIHPENNVATKAKVGGTKQLDLALINALKPDLIIANKEENERSQIETLAKEFPVWISDISNLAGALKMIEGIGAVTEKKTEALILTQQINSQFDQLERSSLTLTVAYFIWRKPYMVAGRHTFIEDMLSRCGLTNIFEAERYLEVNAEMLKELKPDLVLLSSEPYPFKTKHVEEFQQIFPNAIIKLVDGEMFSWYGNRLLEAVGYFKQLAASIINTKFQMNFKIR